MGTIGIIVNPNSGKDIRRLVTHATSIGNMEKVNMLRRIISGILGMGEHEIILMPDGNGLAYHALDSLEIARGRPVHILPMEIRDTQDDTTEFVSTLNKEHAPDVVVVLGGDGTCRAAAKTIDDTPMIAVSTGTNNVYPSMLEGTVVAFAAAAVASGVICREEIPRGKRIDINVGENKHDIALIDVVFSSSVYVGARAILEPEEIQSILVTECRPDSIGFSALAGSLQTINSNMPFGLFAEIDWEVKEYIAAFSSGSLIRYGIPSWKKVNLNEPIHIHRNHEGVLAVDGERELYYAKGDTITLTITHNGPRKVDVPKVVQQAAAKSFFNIKKGAEYAI